MAALLMTRDESPFASIRELTSTERRITDLIDKMRIEVLAAIGKSDAAHELTHAAMRQRGDERHTVIDTYLKQEGAADDRREGSMGVFYALVRGLRVVNEFRWLLAGAFLGLGLVLGNVHVNLSLT